MPHRLSVLAKEAGFKGLFAGLGPRMYGIISMRDWMTVGSYFIQDYDCRSGLQPVPNV